jgi:hypothetical protein
MQLHREAKHPLVACSLQELNDPSSGNAISRSMTAHRSAKGRFSLVVTDEQTFKFVTANSAGELVGIVINQGAELYQSVGQEVPAKSRTAGGPGLVRSRTRKLGPSCPNPAVLRGGHASCSQQTATPLVQRGEISNYT